MVEFSIVAQALINRANPTRAIKLNILVIAKVFSLYKINSNDSLSQLKSKSILAPIPKFITPNAKVKYEYITRKHNP